MKNIRILLFVLAISFCGTLTAQEFPTTQWRDLADTSWYNTTDDSFDFSTPEQLAGLSLLVEEGNTFAGISINIVADIDLDDHLWDPIGYSYEHPFSGDVEGNNHTISNLWITGLERDFIGFFGQSEEASFQNLNLDTAYIDDIGTDSGSLVANLYSSTMENCHAYNVDLKILGSNIGGLTGGVLTEGWIKNSSFSGIVEGINQVGGLTGNVWDLSSVSECYSEGSVTGEYIVGGLVGFVTMAFGPNRENTIENCYSRSSVIATDDFGAAGGLIGFPQTSLIIKNCYATGEVTAPNAAGGFFGKSGSFVSENNYYDTESSNMTEAVGEMQGDEPDVTAKTTSEMKTQEMADLLNAGNSEGPWAFDPDENDGYPFFGEGTMSVTEVTASNIIVYPTITSDFVNITNENKNSSYKLYNTSGVLVREGILDQPNSEISVSELASGLYFLKIQSGNQMVSKKIIKK